MPSLYRKFKNIAWETIQVPAENSQQTAAALKLGKSGEETPPTSNPYRCASGGHPFFDRHMSQTSPNSSLVLRALDEGVLGFRAYSPS